MIPDEYVKQLFSNGNKLLLEHLDSDETLPTQLYRGALLTDLQNQPHSCMRHITVFNKYQIIPKNCFNCYKILIEPRTVMELFKLLVIFDNINLAADNTRKCMVECRKEISGAYKGFIYCVNLEEGETIAKWIHQIVSEEISDKISVTLKRGCSEYALVYPEYAQIGKGAKIMQYKEEWQQCEKMVDVEFIVEENKISTFNKPAYTLTEAKIMLAWLKYAATIGDQSYLKISGETLTPWNNLSRPAPFQPIEQV
jgi:hypothetical protein